MSLSLDATSNLSIFLKTYFDFAYLVCLSPFRFKLHENQYILHGWWPQKIICALGCSSSIFWLIREFRSINWNETKNPSIFFDIMIAIYSNLIKVLLMLKFWKDGPGFLKIVNYIKLQNSQFEQGINPHIDKAITLRRIRAQRTRWLAVGISVLFTSMSALQTLSGKYLSSIYTNLAHSEGRLTYWSAKWWWTRMVDASRYNFFLELEKTLTAIDDKYSWSLLEVLLGILTLSGYITRRILALYGELFLLMVVLTMWTATKNFHTMVESNLEHLKVVDLLISDNGRSSEMKISKRDATWGKHLVGWVEIRSRYEALKKLTKMINEEIGMISGIYMVISMIYYAAALTDVFQIGGSGINVADLISVIFYICAALSILILAADIPHKISCLSDWLAIDENRIQVPTDLVNVILHEINGPTVAFKGKNIYAITYSTLASMLGITITYFIICLQATSSTQGAHTL